jgi:PAS domain S-box-containing protein
MTVAPAHDELIIDSVPGLVAILNPAGDVEAVNDQVLEYCGEPLEAMRHWGTNGIVHAEDVPRIAPVFANAIASGVPYDFDARIRRFDAIYRWFRVRGRPLRESSGNIARWYVLLTDIDDRKHAEVILAGEKRLLEMVANGESMPGVLEGICRFVESTAGECHCSVVLVDPSGLRLEHGAAPSLPDSFIQSIIGRPIAVDAGPCGMAACLNEQVIAGDLTTETRWASWCSVALAHGLQACWSTPIPSTAGKVLGTFAIYYNEPRTPTMLQQSLIEQVTHVASIAIERTQEAETLKRSEALLARVQQVSATGGFYWWPMTGEVYWSEQVYRIFELDPATPLTTGLRQSRIHPDDLHAHQKSVELAMRDGRDFEYEVRLLMPDGSVKYVHSLVHATRDAEGSLLYVGAVQDVTPRRLSEIALSKVRSELAHVARVTTLGALTASIAHEVNQPLSGIITNASTCLRMLGADPPNVDGARETARRTIRDGNRAAEVIAKLRALYSRRDTTLESVDLNEAASEVLALLRNDLHTNLVVLRTEFAEGLPHVRGDRVQLQQVVLNLLRNASDAMSTVDDRTRDLQITTELGHEGGVRLSVRDAGIGFEPDAAEKLFDAFYTTKPDGMGMGLSVSRSIIERHHGRLWGAANEDHGATFVFSLPIDTKV